MVTVLASCVHKMLYRRKHAFVLYTVLCFIVYDIFMLLSVVRFIRGGSSDVIG